METVHLFCQMFENRGGGMVFGRFPFDFVGFSMIFASFARDAVHIKNSRRYSDAVAVVSCDVLYGSVVSCDAL